MSDATSNQYRYPSEPDESSSSIKLCEFQTEYKTVTKGPLALLIQLTRQASTKDFPLNPDDFLTENKGQVAGLGGANLKKILKEHGITQMLASEGGRTSRGNMGLMMKYIGFLNELHDNIGSVDFKALEANWAEQIREFFRNQPFVLTADTSRTVAASLNELFDQARARQKQNQGTQYLGAMLQHLVAAKLMVVMPQDSFEIHGAYVADSPTVRSGDFVIGKTIIHCTTAPGEPLIQKCAANIRAGCQPIIITIFERVRTAFDLAADAGISGRVDVWDVQQFLSTNVNEHSLFDGTARNAKLADIIEKYNAIIEEVETDPSLRIEFEAK
ncbi:MAG: DUF4928 family protein [Synergistaceae bacterium]|nr:DUF4928 family protein [Synergistaceae bacterium]